MLNRREFVSISSLLLASNPWEAFAKESRPLDGGWMDSPVAHREWARNQLQPLTSQQALHLTGTGKGKVVLLWKALELGSKQRYVPHWQKGNDCVGHTLGLGVDVLSAIQTVYNQAVWQGKHSTEVIHAGSRIDIGVEKHGWRLARFWSERRKTLNYGGGSTIVWAVEWLQDYGALVRDRYSKYDLRTYNRHLSYAWRNRGVPADLKVLSAAHPVRTATLIDGGWEQACDLIANGFPIAVGSKVGFNNSYDADGFLKHDRVWNHALLLFAIDSKSHRPGGCFANSKGPNWAKGPQHKHGTPPGCFWADAGVIEKMLDKGVGYAISNFKGYPHRAINDYILG